MVGTTLTFMILQVILSDLLLRPDRMLNLIRGLELGKNKLHMYVTDDENSS